VHQILNLKYSREDEHTADVAGLDYLVRAGYDPYAIVETMQMLQDQDKEKPVEFLSTHPDPQNRIKYLTERIQTRYQNFTNLKVGKEDYQKAVLEKLGD
jgi:predicted Zn-dependent protease